MTVQGPVKKPQPDGMSHREGGGVEHPLPCGCLPAYPLWSPPAPPPPQKTPVIPESRLPFFWSSSWRTGGCAGCCAGRFTVSAAHSPPHPGRPPPAWLCFCGSDVRRAAVASPSPRPVQQSPLPQRAACVCIAVQHMTDYSARKFPEESGNVQALPSRGSVNLSHPFYSSAGTETAAEAEYVMLLSKGEVGGMCGILLFARAEGSVFAICAPPIHEFQMRFFGLVCFARVIITRAPCAGL